MFSHLDYRYFNLEMFVRVNFSNSPNIMVDHQKILNLLNEDKRVFLNIRRFFFMNLFAIDKSLWYFIRNSLLGCVENGKRKESI